MTTSIRYANVSDAKVLLDWRNNPYVRQYSKTSKFIEEKAHLPWLINRLERLKSEPLFIFEIDGVPAGTARLDFFLEAEKIYQVSILIDPKFQGFGFAKVLLTQICDYAFTQLMAVKLVAYIHKQNTKSLNLFRAAGFELTKEDEIFLKYQKSSRP